MSANRFDVPPITDEEIDLAYNLWAYPPMSQQDKWGVALLVRLQRSENKYDALKRKHDALLEASRELIGWDYEGIERLHSGYGGIAKDRERLNALVARRK